GGDGVPFNLGEATVTRAAIQIASGEVGIAYILGRDPNKARLSAVCDALWQSKRYRDAVERRVLAPIRTRVDAERGRPRAQTAPASVVFSTWVRGGAGAPGRHPFPRRGGPGAGPLSAR